jgi:hypothetical protein
MPANQNHPSTFGGEKIYLITELIITKTILFVKPVVLQARRVPKG